MDPFMVLLHEISTGLNEEELKSLKFLCHDKVGRKKLEKITQGTELFTILLEQNEISPDNMDFLSGLLKHLKRENLLEKLKQFQEQGGEPDQLDPKERQRMDVAYDYICDNVGKEWKMFVRKLGVRDSKIDGIIDANPSNMQEQILKSLKAWEKMKGGKASAKDLVAALRSSRLNLIADGLEEKLK
ncbi:protein FADD [Latimeria chalumnae]|nr:PREDICTED: FAS-associated death domain protein [Latimeria chalumnae]|eukprot:XP_005996275.1 PREDICTED: FAS-associated death domain protein [Latimeria chalumnae]